MRPAVEVFEDHLRLRSIGDVEGDLERNYAEDIVLLCEPGVLRGRDAVRNSARRLAWQIPGAGFEFPVRRLEGDFALLVWSARAAGQEVHHGVDTFVIRDGRIVMQSIYYRVVRHCG
jgi:hypothetical protein